MFHPAPCLTQVEQTVPVVRYQHASRLCGYSSTNGLADLASSETLGSNIICEVSKEQCVCIERCAE